MGLRLIKEEVSEAAVAHSEAGDITIGSSEIAEVSPTFRSSNHSSTLQTLSYQSGTANEIVELSQQLIGSADAAVDVLNDLVCGTESQL